MKKRIDLLPCIPVEALSLTMAIPITLSVVVPVYQSAAVLPQLAEALLLHVPCASEQWEAICVDDGSTDSTWSVLSDLSLQYPFIQAVRSEANQGQHAAIAQGLALARGKWTVVMDCDLADHPAAIPALYQKALEGYPVVRAVRQPSGTWYQQLASRVFHQLFTLCTGIPYPAHIGNFGIYHQTAIRQIMQQPDPLGIFTIRVARANLPMADLPVVQGKSANPSTYNLKKRCQLAFHMLRAYHRPFFGK